MFQVPCTGGGGGGLILLPAENILFSYEGQNGPPGPTIPPPAVLTAANATAALIAVYVTVGASDNAPLELALNTSLTDEGVGQFILPAWASALVSYGFYFQTSASENSNAIGVITNTTNGAPGNWTINVDYSPAGNAGSATTAIGYLLGYWTT